MGQDQMPPPQKKDCSLRETRRSLNAPWECTPQNKFWYPHWSCCIPQNVLVISTLPIEITPLLVSKVGVFPVHWGSNVFLWGSNLFFLGGHMFPLVVLLGMPWFLTFQSLVLNNPRTGSVHQIAIESSIEGGMWAAHKVKRWWIQLFD